MTSDSLTPAAPPADALEEETFVLNGLVSTDLLRTVDVPPISLVVGEKIVRHPDDGSDVKWRVLDVTHDEDGHLVVAYRTSDGDEDEYPFTDPDQWVRVGVGPVTR